MERHFEVMGQDGHEWWESRGPNLQTHILEYMDKGESFDMSIFLSMKGMFDRQYVYLKKEADEKDQETKLQELVESYTQPQEGI